MGRVEDLSQIKERMLQMRAQMTLRRLRMTGRRLHVLIDSDLDAALEVQAGRERTSKAAIVRRALRQTLPPLEPWWTDGFAPLSGVDDFEPSPLLPNDVYR